MNEFLVLFPFWILGAPLLFAAFDLARTRRAMHHPTHREHAVARTGGGHTHAEPRPMAGSAYPPAHGEPGRPR